LRKLRFASSRESAGEAADIELASELCERPDGTRANKDGFIAIFSEFERAVRKGQSNRRVGGPPSVLGNL
jgi:hypothetical protein